jgi:hypothetical protein
MPDPDFVCCRSKCKFFYSKTVRKLVLILCDIYAIRQPIIAEINLFVISAIIIGVVSRPAESDVTKNSIQVQQRRIRFEIPVFILEIWFSTKFTSFYLHQHYI